MQGQLSDANKAFLFKFKAVQFLSDRYSSAMPTTTAITLTAATGEAASLTGIQSLAAA